MLPVRRTSVEKAEREREREGESRQPRTHLSNRVPLDASSSSSTPLVSSQQRPRRRLLPLVATSGPLEPEFLEVITRSLEEATKTTGPLVVVGV